MTTAARRRPESRTCRCGTVFKSRTWRHIHCGLTCRNKSWTSSHPAKQHDDKECSECGNSFTPKHSRHKFCSTACKHNSAKIKVSLRKCRHCRMDFAPKNRQHAYCSADCKQNGYDRPAASVARGRIASRDAKRRKRATEISQNVDAARKRNPALASRLQELINKENQS